jgi:hypothetical protein
MIPEEAADLLQHALQKLQPGIWYVVDDVNGFNPSFRKSINISPFLYENFLQLCGFFPYFDHQVNKQKADSI